MKKMGKKHVQEFAKTIEMFDERLLRVEESVQKELLSIKSIAESLRTSVNALLHSQMR
jgi:hypothetical protein